MLAMPFVGACRAAPHSYRNARCSIQFPAGSLSSYGHSIRLRGRKCEIEWNRLTVCKIISSHFIAASLGLVLIILGSMYSKEAYYNKRTSVPLLLCILANVTGLILVSGTFALAKVTLGKLKQQRLALAAAASSSDAYGGEAHPLGPPPPYSAYGDPSVPYRDDQRQVYVDVNIHPQTATTNIMISPPEYTCELPDYSEPPPPYQSNNNLNLIVAAAPGSRRS